MNNRLLLTEALEHLETAVRLAPDHPRYRKSLGEAYLAAGDPANAVLHLRRTGDQETDPRVRYLLALAYLQMGRLDEVERLVEGFVQHHEETPRARYVRALARFKRGDFEAALADFREVQVFGADRGFYTMALARMLLLVAGETPEPARRQHVEEALAVLHGLTPAPAHRDEWHQLVACAERRPFVAPTARLAGLAPSSRAMLLPLIVRDANVFTRFESDKRDDVILPIALSDLDQAADPGDDP